MSDKDKAEKPERVLAENEKAYAEMVRRGVKGRVKQIRELADEIEREAERAMQNVSSPRDASYDTYARVAQIVTHRLMWGLANLHLDILVDNATQADVARARGE